MEGCQNLDRRCPQTCHVHLRLALFTAVTACQPLAVGSTVPTVPELLSITTAWTSEAALDQEFNQGYH
jgi:hypothetical protein